MRKPSSRTSTARKRSKPEPHDIAWKVVMPTLPPIPTPEEIAAALAAEAARKRSAQRGPRPPQQCTVSYTDGGRDGQSVPMLRLRGRWLEQSGFTIGRKVHVSVAAGEVGIRVAEEPSPPASPPRDPEVDRLIKEAILGLPPRCRLAFGLLHADRMSYPQIAETMGISVKQVEKYICKGLMACRAALGDRKF